MLYTFERRKRRTRRKILKVVFFFFLIFILFFAVHRILNKPPQETISKLKLITTQKTNDGLKKIVEEELSGTKGEYAVAIENLKTGESYYLNEHKMYDSASLYKLWIMAVSLEEIEKGNLSENEVLKEEVKTLNEKFNISTESAELTEGEVSYSVKVAMDKMITISHNYAALLLTKRIGLSKVRIFLEENGFKESKVGTEGDSPMVSAHDIALFYKKMYNGELASKDVSKRMNDLLLAQQLDKKIPKYLPKDTPIAHKTGELGLFSHDTGIIYLGDEAYILVILTRTSSPLNANERIANISKSIYEYFGK